MKTQKHRAQDSLMGRVKAPYRCIFKTDTQKSSKYEKDVQSISLKSNLKDKYQQELEQYEIKTVKHYWWQCKMAWAILWEEKELFFFLIVS